MGYNKQQMTDTDLNQNLSATSNPDGKSPSLSKKPIFWIVIVLVLIAVISLLAYFGGLLKNPVARQENLSEAQLNELDALRRQAGYKQPTEEEIKNQTIEADQLREESGYETPTSEQIEKQIEELNKLKSQ